MSATAKPGRPRSIGMTIATKLSEARKLIERGWCQGWYARNAKGRRASPRGKVATCYCAIGALMRVTDTDEYRVGMRREYGFLRDAVHDFPEDFNDAAGRTKEQVIEAFKRAEQLARDSAE